MSVPLMKYWSISSINITNEAKKMGLKVDILSKSKNLFYIKGEGKEILFKSTDFGGNSSLGLKIANDKELTYKILERNKLPIAKTWYIDTNNIDTISKLGIDFPVIIKPLEEGHGNGVMMNILDLNELKEKLDKSLKSYSKMIIQKQINGGEFRILVVKGDVILIKERVPAYIIGNGINTIEELIEKENRNNDLRGDGYNKPLSNIKIISVYYFFKILYSYWDFFGHSF